MKTKITLCAFLCTLFVSQTINAREVVKGNGNVVTREISIRDYDRVAVSGRPEFVYEQSDAAPYLEVTVDENILSHLKLEVSGSKLSVGVKQNSEIRPTVYKIKTNSRKLVEGSFSGSGKSSLNNIKGRNNLKLGLSGSGRVSVNRLEVSDLNVSVSGSGTIEASDISIDDVKSSVSGSGKVNLEGRATKGDFKVSGSGKIQAENCIINTVKANVSGSGSIYTHVTDDLSGGISGSGKIYYKGERPSINTRTSGSGRVLRID